MPTKKFSVIIPSHNEGDWLRRTVMGVLENTDYPDFEIVVVADGCTDNSTEFLQEKHIPNVTLISLPVSVGAAKARNKGAHKATGEYLVFIDSHMIPHDANWLTELFLQLEQKNIGVASLCIPHLEEPDRIAYVYTVKDLFLEPTWEAPLDKNKTQLVPVISGACFGITKKLFDETGGFDEGLQKWGREDLEYSLRLWRMGYDLSMSPCAAIAHSWERKRTFEISWEEVDYNILRTVMTLFSKEWAEKVIAAVKCERPENAKHTLTELQKDQKFLARKNVLESQFTRSFEQYLEGFKGMLPMAE